VRKFALLAVSALVVALGITGVASAIQGGQGISIKLSKKKAGTAKKPRNVGVLRVVTTTTPTPAEVGKFATKTATIYFDKNLVFSPSKFKTCPSSTVLRNPGSCPRGSKIGTGSAAANLGPGAPISLSVTPYNGPKATLSLLVRGSGGIAINSALTGKLKNAGGGYGKKLVVTIPSNLQQPAPGTFATLTSFITNVGGVGKGKVPYVGLKGCTGGKVKIKGVFNFTDGTSKTATSSTPCTK
jgi:hypothetical protein